METLLNPSINRAVANWLQGNIMIVRCNNLFLLASLLAFSSLASFSGDCPLFDNEGDEVDVDEEFSATAADDDEEFFVVDDDDDVDAVDDCLVSTGGEDGTAVDDDDDDPD